MENNQYICQHAKRHYYITTIYKLQIILILYSIENICEP